VSIICISEQETQILISTTSKDPQLEMMHTFFSKDNHVSTVHSENNPAPLSEAGAQTTKPRATFQNLADLVSYPSDLSSEDSESSDEDNSTGERSPERSGRLPAVPPRKRKKLDVSYRVQREQKRKQRSEELEKALKDLEKLLKSKKTKFVGGMQGLQA